MHKREATGFAMRIVPRAPSESECISWIAGILTAQEEKTNPCRKKSPLILMRAEEIAMG
jgi:hypothetical protein